MDPGYISAVAALAGSMIGGLTSIAASWISNHSQFRAQQLTHAIARREDLYKGFIVEAAKLYADAYGSNNAEPARLVNLVSQLSLMRVVSSPPVVEHADRVVRRILETYQAPNKTFADVEDFLSSDAVDPLRQFSNACRAELGTWASS